MGKVTLTGAQAGAKIEIMDNITNLFGEDVVPSGGGKVAVRREAEVDGEMVEFWIEIQATAKSAKERVVNKETGETRAAFCPWESQKAYDDEQAAKRAQKEATAATRKTKKKKQEAEEE